MTRHVGEQYEEQQLRGMWRSDNGKFNHIR